MARYTSGRALEVRDLQWLEWSVILTLKLLKTNQRRQGEFTVLQEDGKTEIYPVGGIKDYITIRLVENGPLFLHGDGRHLTKYQFVAVVEKGAWYWKGEVSTPVYH